jgi:hypothetical protein
MEPDLSKTSVGTLNNFLFFVGKSGKIDTMMKVLISLSSLYYFCIFYYIFLYYISAFANKHTSFVISFPL